MSVPIFKVLVCEVVPTWFWPMRFRQGGVGLRYMALVHSIFAQPTAILSQVDVKKVTTTQISISRAVISLYICLIISKAFYYIKIALCASSLVIQIYCAPYYHHTEQYVETY